MTALARRYARAAVAVIDEQGDALDALVRGMEAFRGLLQNSNELRQVLVNPAFAHDRMDLLEAALVDLTPAAANLVRLLVESGRLALIDDVAAELSDIVDERAGKLRAHVVSAIALTPAQVQQVGSALEKRLGRSVAVDVQVDAAILGGLVCRVGDLTFDTSIKRQLEILRERLEG